MSYAHSNTNTLDDDMGEKVPVGTVPFHFVVNPFCSYSWVSLNKCMVFIKLQETS